MMEGIALIIFSIVGGLSAMLALFFIIMAVVRHSRRMLKLGFIVAIIPVSMFALAYWFYKDRIPGLLKREEISYAGTYIMIASDTTDAMARQFRQQTKITLNADNTFQLDKNNFTSFYGSGTWKAGATDDGQFEFRDTMSNIIFRATPSNHNKLEINKNFTETKRIVFLK
ncbi:MAG TPA: hypothetical protein VGD17_01165 [Chitinophagaceae bacterium]